MSALHPGIVRALAAAVLFGASMPLAKALVGQMSPILLAGLLYAGSGVGLAIGLALRRALPGRAAGRFSLPNGSDLGWLLGAIVVGGILGPIALMVGLVSTPASASALLLNLEPVATAVLAWLVFREHFHRRIAVGMALIVAGGLLLSFAPGAASRGPGALFVAAACVCWAIDNNLTRKVAANDAMTIACAKGVVAGAVNIGIALAYGASMPPTPVVAAAAIVGLFGYGISLTLFVVALRELGTARTGAYFAIAPFVGAALAVVFGHEEVTTSLGVAAGLMAWGVWLHVTETHAHLHEHLPIEHSHRHVHDAHHRHEHDASDAADEPHEHRHVHAAIRHAHPHFPDIHHRHAHSRRPDRGGTGASK